MRERLKKTCLLGAVVVSVGCAYAFFWVKTGLSIPCPFHLLTGLNCPGCGVSRMMLSLLRLDFAAAFRYNAVLFCLLPVLLGLGALYVIRYVRLGTKRAGKTGEAIVWTLVGVLLSWGVVRNLVGM